MEQRVTMNDLKKELHTYVNSRSRKPLNDIRKCMSKAYLRPFSFLGSSEVPLPCGAQGRV